MSNNDFRKASQHFNAKYGDDYYNASKIFDFGWSCLPRVIQYSDLPSDAKICMAVMIDLKHNSNSPNPQLYYPSQKRIAFLSGLSVSAVSRAMSKLEKAKLIGKFRLGLGKQNVYCLLNPPEEFVLNAIRRRSIIELLRQKKLDWCDINEKGEVIIEDATEKKSAQTLVNALICKYANQENQLCKSRFANQEVRNAPGSAPTLEVDNSELSSVELTSEESSSDDDCGKNGENLTTQGEPEKKLNNQPNRSKTVDLNKLDGLNKCLMEVGETLEKHGVTSDGNYKNWNNSFVAQIRKWFDDGIPTSCVVEGIETTMSRHKNGKINSAKFFENEVQKAYEAHKAQEKVKSDAQVSVDQTSALLAQIRRNRG